MGLHSSLKRAEKMRASRSVMTRTERIKWLAEKGQWVNGKRVLGLPKIKVVKLKTVKKEKQKEEQAPTPENATVSETKPAEQTHK
jgi:small basic protein (TIGR04137 family)